VDKGKEKFIQKHGIAKRELGQIQQGQRTKGNELVFHCHGTTLKRPWE
jgi:hypothetical protein